MINKNIRSLIPSATLRINERSSALEKAGKTVYKLGFGQSPFPVPEVLITAMQKHAHEKAYLPVKGLIELREAVAVYYERTQKLTYTAENILIAPGSKMLLFAIQLAFDGDIILPAPSWVSYAPQAQIIGKKTHWIRTSEENNWNLSAEDLNDFCKKQGGKKILLLNYPNNPTGTTYNATQLKALARVARKYDLLIVSDEIYGELHHEGQHISIASFAPERTIISSGLSKWAGAGGWRIGTAVFPNELELLKNTVATIASETFTTTSAPIQYGSIPAFQDLPELEYYRQTVRRILKHVGNFVFETLNHINITTPQPQGGFYSFINFEHHRKMLTHRNITTCNELSEVLLEKTGIALLPSIDFGLNSDELIFRLSYVDFDGKSAIEAASTDYHHQELDDDFTDKYTPKIKEAMEKLKNWL